LSPEWRLLLAAATLRLCRNFVARYPQILVEARPQAGEPSVYPRRRPEDSELDPDKTLAQQFNLLRVVDNESYPAFFRWAGQRFVLKVQACGTDERDA
jgi:hypothetical protein